MRVLIVFHGWFPRPDRPVAGGALRAWHHAEALRAAGHDVHLVTREQDAVPDGPPTFRSGPDLLAHARRVQPEVVLCVQPEEAPSLAPLGVPMAVDLYAPRLLEAQFQDATGEEAVQTLRAIQAGDFFLFSNPRQRFYFLGLLAMAGVDLRSDAFGAVVPLVAPEGPPRRPPSSPLFVLGGVAWPWIDPLEGLSRAVAHLRKRRKGKLLVLGGQPAVGSAAVRDLPAALPPGPRLIYRGPVPYEELLTIYAGATAALDLMAPTPERSIAVAFRHMDYLGCGLPMIVGAEHVLGDALREAGAGLVGLPVEEAIDRVLDAPEEHEARAAAARELARASFNRDVCEAALLAWLKAPVRRERRATPIAARAELAAHVASAEAARGEAERLCARLQAEVGAKRDEVAGLVEQIRSLSVSNERLSGAVAEVAGFKREAIAVLGGAGGSARERAESLRAEIAVLAADTAKKSAEIDNLAGEKRSLSEQLVLARRGLERLEGAVSRLQVEVAGQADELEVARLDAQKKSGEVDALEREKRLLRDQIALIQSGLGAELASLTQDRDDFRDQVEAAWERHARLEEEVRQNAQGARQAARDLARAEADIAKKAAEIEALHQAALVREEERSLAVGARDEALIALRRAEAEHGATQRLLDRARQEAEAAVSALADARSDATAKGVELEILQQARAGMIAERDAAVAALDSVRVAGLRHEAELGLTRQQLDETRAAQDRLDARAAALEADLAAKAAAVAALERSCEQERGRTERVEAQLERARVEAGTQRDALARAEAQLGQAAARLEAMEVSLADTAEDIDKKNKELEGAWAERDRLERIVAELKAKR